MRVGVLGTGVVGRTLAGALAQAGHEVIIGTRDPAATLARGAEGSGSAFAEWLQGHPGVELRSFEDAAARSEIVVHASAGSRALDVLTAAGASNLAGKVLVDVSNPLDFSAGFPPTLFVKDADSLAEQIQRAFPDAKVVKTLNTVSSQLMAAPRDLAGGAHTIFVSSDHGDAKAAVTALLHELGWDDVLDLGDLSTARGPEMYLALWVRMVGVVGRPDFNIKVVR